ncbi:hypothetical protein F8388_004380 [Cannabis sativa]|uniref:Replication factor A C-terminal domain-containing protein n=1 Tax=Cannabis sativa TaxID=3483 RepID=A0A7J6H4I5_CANSA|nr:hypothetical protein F8388_014648 [Cannabis sativa]KAF4389369.1 hypothetical protein G4B88_006428 [Cannabis sativa]KAF4392051.1 hypothetical protein F8388_004380 [Cannabis sativa]
MTALQPTEIAKFWIQGKVVIKNLSQSFYYMSCPGCNKGAQKNYNERFLCLCGYESTATPRARIYGQINDDTGSVSVIMFGHEAEQVLGCYATKIIEYSEEEKNKHIENVINELTTKYWILQIYADQEKMKTQRYKNFNVYSIEEAKQEEVPNSSS